MSRSTLPSCALALVLTLAGCAQPGAVTLLAAPEPLASEPVAEPAEPQADPVVAPEPRTAALPPVLTEDRTDPRSGTLGDWRPLTPALSTPQQFRRVRDQNGVLVVGDSIAKGTAYELATRLDVAHGLLVAVNAHPGRPTEPAADWIVANAHLIPERGIVVVAGANDVFAPFGWWEQVTRVLEAADGRPVYWLTVHVDRWSGDAGLRAADRHNSAWLNEQLRAVAAEHPNLVVVDWAAELTDDWLDDGVHPSAAGTAAWCGLLERALGLAP